MKIVTVLGARPQFIKASTVSRAIAGSDGVEEILVHTGQHYDTNMSDVFFRELEIPNPAYHLGIGSESHGAQTGRMIESIETVLLDERPDWVLVYGDTNSTLAGALAAVKLHIPIAHVEAGLRSFNRRMPEEINRVLTDHASDLLFAPTDAAVANLRAEGKSDSQVYHVGDVMYDAALYFGDKAEKTSRILSELGLDEKQYVLATIHRAENTDDPLRLDAVMGGLMNVSGELPVVLPIHPRTRAALERENLSEELADAVLLIDPVGYLDMVQLERQALCIATDSGGVQKEAYFHRVPCVTLRNETEWVELVDAGWNVLCPPLSRTAVAKTVLSGAVTLPGEAPPLYGDGDAAQQIVELVVSASESE